MPKGIYIAFNAIPVITEFLISSKEPELNKWELRALTKNRFEFAGGMNIINWVYSKEDCHTEAELKEEANTTEGQL